MKSGVAVVVVVVAVVLRDADKYIAQVVMVQRAADKAFLPFAMMMDPG